MALSHRSLPIGEALTLSVQLNSSARSAQAMVIDCAVHPVRANGSTSAKVFDGCKLHLASGDSVSLRKPLPMRERSTRRLYPGHQRVTLLTATWRPVHKRVKVSNKHPVLCGLCRAHSFACRDTALSVRPVSDLARMNLKNAIFQRLLARWSRQSVTIKDLPANTLPAAAPRHPVQTAPQLDRLEVQAALIEHLEWCVKFNERLGRERDTDQALPGAADSGLGRWLASLRLTAQGQHPLIADLEQEHLRFHALAEKALALADSGHMHLASTLLNTDFERSRARLLDMLRTLQRS